MSNSRGSKLTVLRGGWYKAAASRHESNQRHSHPADGTDSIHLDSTGSVETCTERPSGWRGYPAHARRERLRT
jgi:hypothetical protein